MILGHRKLIGHHKLIVLRTLKVNQPQPRATRVTVLLQIDGYALSQQAMEGLVIRQQVGRVDASHFLERHVNDIPRQLVVNPPGCLRQSITQQYVCVATAFRVLTVRRDVWAMQVGVAKAHEQLDGKGFNGGLGEHLAYSCGYFS